jgi:hypothetical protein
MISIAQLNMYCNLSGTYESGIPKSVNRDLSLLEEMLMSLSVNAETRKIDSADEAEWLVAWGDSANRFLNRPHLLHAHGNESESTTQNPAGQSRAEDIPAPEVRVECC